MDSKFIITQLINAAITVATTIIVVRFTMKGSFGISPSVTQRLRITIGKYGGLVFNLLLLALPVIGLLQWVGFNRFDTPNRAEVFIICLMTCAGLFMLKETANSLLNIIAPKETPDRSA